MDLKLQLTMDPIPALLAPPGDLGAGAWTEFRGLVRDHEDGRQIGALEYEAYAAMAESEMRRLVQELGVEHRCLSVSVIHRLGVIPVGEAAIYVGIASRHRAEGFGLLAAFMDRLKQDVPIWKTRSHAAAPHTP